MPPAPLRSTHAYRSTAAAYALWRAKVSAVARQLRLQPTGQQRPHASARRRRGARKQGRAATPKPRRGAAHHQFTTMDTSMTFDNAAPCATRCNFCSQCVHYRTNVRIQRRREKQARDRQRGIAAPPPPEPAPSLAKRREQARRPFVDVLSPRRATPAVPQSAPARLATFL